MWLTFLSMACAILGSVTFILFVESLWNRNAFVGYLTGYAAMASIIAGLGLVIVCLLISRLEDRATLLTTTADYVLYHSTLNSKDRAEFVRFYNTELALIQLDLKYLNSASKSKTLALLPIKK